MLSLGAVPIYLTVKAGQAWSTPFWVMVVPLPVSPYLISVARTFLQLIIPGMWEAAQSMGVEPFITSKDRARDPMCRWTLDSGRGSGILGSMP